MVVEGQVCTLIESKVGPLLVPSNCLVAEALRFESAAVEQMYHEDVALVFDLLMVHDCRAEMISAQWVSS